MKTLVLEINEQKKQAFGQLLQELKRLNIRIFSIDGQAVTDTEEVVQIDEAPADANQVPAAPMFQKSVTNVSKKVTRKTRATPKIARSTQHKSQRGEAVSWQFSNHILPGIAQKTFSREEIYEDAAWKKNLH